MALEELVEYYAKLCTLPPDTKPPVVIDNDTGEPLHSGVAD
ncbi:hypothetical protein [Bradyrhizobium sp. DASA03120]